MKNLVYLGDNLPLLEALPEGKVDLIYIDPPFNTGKAQSRTRIKTVESADGDRVGFQGKRYETIPVRTQAYNDRFGHHLDDYLLAFLAPRLRAAHRVLAAHGSLYFHIDYREVHYCKILLDLIFGQENFLNQIIWAYDYGGRSRSRWPAKHDNILMYVKDIHSYRFAQERMAALEFRAPGRAGAEARQPSDAWWHTIVPTNSPERTGYPTQKPIGILKPMIAVSSDPGDLVLDFFAGSGAVGAACRQLDRRFILADNNPQAWTVWQTRFAGAADITWLQEPGPAALAACCAQM
ncbi:MAG TPA: site-specific DNA-methyltransferase [Anaerolineales bacterium]|nr:site-specific DNA-methyltransferase [Anaerolineales bacterium]